MVDRADDGRATAAGAGIVCPWGSAIDDAASYALLAGGARYYQPSHCAARRGGETDLGYARVGGLYVPSDPHELAAVERRARARAVRRQKRASIERLSAADARALFPPSRGDQPALFVSGGARVDGRRLTAALKRAALKRKVNFLNGSAELVAKAAAPWACVWARERLEAEAVAGGRRSLGAVPA